MRSHRKKQWQEKISLWSVGWLPGLIIIMTVIVGRLTGQLQSLEWFAFDRFLKLRSPEAIDERILIIGIDELQQSIRVYPNPTTQSININSNTIIKQTSISTLKGSVIQSINYNSAQIEIDLSELESGIYIIRTKLIDGSVLFEKVVKQ